MSSGLEHVKTLNVGGGAQFAIVAGWSSQQGYDKHRSTAWYYGFREDVDPAILAGLRAEYPAVVNWPTLESWPTITQLVEKLKNSDRLSERGRTYEWVRESNHEAAKGWLGGFERDGELRHALWELTGSYPMTDRLIQLPQLRAIWGKLWADFAAQYPELEATLGNK